MAVCTGANIFFGDKEPLQATDNFFPNVHFQNFTFRLHRRKWSFSKTVTVSCCVTFNTVVSFIFNLRVLTLEEKLYLFLLGAAKPSAITWSERIGTTK